MGAPKGVGDIVNNVEPKLKKVVILHRHGARSPTLSAIDKISKGINSNVMKFWVEQ